MVIAGTAEEDPRRFLLTLDPLAPIVLDESAPHQFFPDDTAFALVPVGAVVWQAGVPGQFVEPDEPTMRLSRTLRRNVGVIAEQVLAADGVIRLMDRRADLAAGQSIDDLAQKTAISVDDLAAVGQRFVGNELVWIEGHTRARGDVRLWGTRLELRDITGAEKNNAPLWLRRFTSAKNAANGEDLQTAIGAAPDGANRFTVGPFDAGTADLDPRFIVDSKGRAGIGPGLPGNLDNNNLLVTSADEARRRHRQRRAEILPPGLHRATADQYRRADRVRESQAQAAFRPWRRSRPEPAVLDDADRYRPSRPPDDGARDL